MNEFKIAIPSRGRANEVDTIKLLSSFDKEDIFIFVLPEEYDEYFFCYGDRANIIKTEGVKKGIVFARNFIFNFFKNKIRFLLVLDDDMEGIYKRTEYNEEKKYWYLKKLDGDEIKQVMLECVEIAKKYNLFQLGLNFKASNWTFNGDIKFNTRVKSVVLWDMNQAENYDENCEVMEDYEITARLLLKGGTNGLVYKYAFDAPTLNTKKGGCNLPNRAEMNIRACKYLKAKYGVFAKIFFHEAHKLYEVQFNWDKLAEAGRSKIKSGGGLFKWQSS